MYNPFDENNTTNNAKDNEPLEQDTAREEEPVNASQPETPASPEYHYTGSEVKDRAPSEQQTTYTASGYGQQPGSYSGQGQQSPYPTQTGWQYGNQPQAANTYTWNGQQSNVPAYTPVQPKPKKHRDGKKAKKVALRVVAAVLCCAVVSFASVGIFAAMIQTGFINIENTGSGETAAFTLYRQADDSGDTSSNVVTTDSLSRQEAAQKVIPSVVCIQNYQITSQGFYFGGGSSDDGSAGSLAGEGSGIIISEDGYIVTNQHVIDSASKLEVVTSDGVSYEATLVGEDTQTDLAVIKIDATGLTAAEFADSADLQVGDEVMAVGNPGGLQLSSSVTFGYVSALNRPVTNSDTGYTVNCIQTDAAINPGNSGGPTFNAAGQVIGINSSIASTATSSDSAGSIGIGFAIPSNLVKRVADEIIKDGKVKHVALGVVIKSDTVEADGVTRGGATITKSSATGSAVVSGGPADKAGLKEGDTIVAFNGNAVNNNYSLLGYVRAAALGDKVTLTIVRDGKTMNVDVTLDQEESSVNGSSGSDSNGNSQNNQNNQNGNGQNGYGNGNGNSDGGTGDGGGFSDPFGLW